MKQLIPLGAVLAIVGLMLFAYPFFTTQQTKEVLTSVRCMFRKMNNRPI